MSIRDRIKKFEALNEDERKQDDAGAAATQPGKKFCYPGRQSKPQMEAPIIPQSRSKPSILSDFEAGLQEVWSVRKNIHHSQMKPSPSTALHPLNTSLTNGNSRFPQSYSRHGAIAAQQTGAPQGDMRLGNMDTHRDHHQPESRTWNLRQTGFSYTDSGSRPTLKDSPPKRFSHNQMDTNDRKLNYAKKMAQAHLKSTGMGEYTPKNSGYHRSSRESDDGTTTRWTKFDEQDEFSF